MRKKCKEQSDDEKSRFVSYSCEAPHSVEESPAGVACDPRYAAVKVVPRTIPSPTDDQPPPRQKGEAVVSPLLRKIRDGAGVGGRAREQLHV